MTLQNKKQIRVVELRSAQVEQPENENEMIISGYASVFDSPTVLFETQDGTQYKEVIARGAFFNTNFKDCCLKYNHSNNIPIMARSRGGSLQTLVDDKGLYFRANLFNTSVSRDIHELVRAGGLDKCSFAFYVNEEEYDSENRTRIIKSFKSILDISIVDTPAYLDTSCEARSFFEAQERAKSDAEREKLAKQLIIRTYF